MLFRSRFSNSQAGIVSGEQATAPVPKSPAMPPRDTPQQDQTATGTATTDALTVPVFYKQNAFFLKASINGGPTLDFCIDTGSADISLSEEVVQSLKQSSLIQPSDFTGTKTYVLANGTEIVSPILNLRSLTVGGVTVQNLTASVSSRNSDLLIGLSFFKKFKGWRLNNQQNVLVLDR